MDYDCGFDMDFGFMDDEDFGLAKSFTTAPIGLCNPGISLQSAEEPNIEKECENEILNKNPIEVEGFNFKMHPVDDQVQF